MHLCLCDVCVNGLAQSDPYQPQFNPTQRPHPQPPCNHTKHNNTEGRPVTSPMTRSPMPPLFFPSHNVKKMVDELLAAQRAAIRAEAGANGGGGGGGEGKDD